MVTYQEAKDALFVLQRFLDRHRPLFESESTESAVDSEIHLRLFLMLKGVLEADYEALKRAGTAEAEELADRILEALNQKAAEKKVG
jgi:hypothetical protein